jgi:hypothetical protein
MKRHGLMIKLHNRRVRGTPYGDGSIVFEFRILRDRATRQIDATRIRLSDEATRAMVRIALELLGFRGIIDGQIIRKEQQ